MDIQVNLPADPSKHDALLRRLTYAIKGTQLQIGITLTVGGFIISGLLVSSHSFLEHFREEFVKMCSDAEVANKMKIECEEGHKVITAPKSDEDLLPEYICLKDAEVYHPNAAMGKISLGWWRGRISKIDGFRIGLLHKLEPAMSTPVQGEL